MRQPLSRLWVFDLEEKRVELDDELRQQIAQELNVKQVITGQSSEELVTRELKLNGPVLGPRLGPAMKDVTRAAREGDWSLEAEGLRIAGQLLVAGEFEIEYAGRDGYAAAQDRGRLVVLDTAITEELRREGHARDVVRFVQDLRKQAGYKVEDRIALFYEAARETEGGRVVRIFDAHGEYIAEETLSREIRRDRAEVDLADELVLEKDLALWLGVKRLES